MGKDKVLVTTEDYIDSLKNEELGKLYLDVIRWEDSAKECFRIGHRINVSNHLKQAYEKYELIYDFYQSIEIDKSVEHFWSLEFLLLKHIIGTEIKRGELSMNISYALTLGYVTNDTEKEILEWQAISRKHFDKAFELSWTSKNSCYLFNVQKICNRCYNFLDMGVNISFNKEEPAIKEPVQDKLF